MLQATVKDKINGAIIYYRFDYWKHTSVENMIYTESKIKFSWLTHI